MTAFNLNRKQIFLLAFLLFPLFIYGQNKPKLYIKQGDTLRLASDSKKMIDATITLVIPADRDTSNKKKDYAIQDSLKAGTVLIELDKNGTNTDQSKTTIPLKNEFKLDSLKKELQFEYTVRVPRDLQDDRVLALIVTAKDSKGKLISQLKKRVVLYIKPYVPDTLSSSDKLELWFHTGTNFDFFNGGSLTQEFFFRINMLFKVSDRVYGQVAFYKNRFFSDGPNSEENLNFTSVKPPAQFGDSLYTFMSGTYKKTTKQTTDPLASQLDILYKMTDDETSNFFVSAGWNISTTSVSVKNDYTYLDTTYSLRTSRPDTVTGANRFGTTRFPGSFDYKKPAYNFNVGFMWIFNDKTLNVKAQLLSGWSKFFDLKSRKEISPGVYEYNLESKNTAYIQLGAMATYRPFGISFGMEMFWRDAFPAFNFTLSKTFDLKNFASNLSSVAGLKVK